MIDSDHRGPAASYEVADCVACAVRYDVGKQVSHAGVVTVGRPLPQFGLAALIVMESAIGMVRGVPDLAGPGRR
jgi:hypothetical protein